MGSHSDKENGEKSRSKSRDSKASVPKTDPKGSGNSNGNSAGTADAHGGIAGASVSEPAVVAGSSAGRQHGPAAPVARGRDPPADMVRRPAAANNAGNHGLVDQMRARPGVGDDPMLAMMSRMEKSHQMMVDLMLQQTQAKMPDAAGFVTDLLIIFCKTSFL